MAYSPTKPDATPCAADAATRFSTATGQTVIPVDTLVALLDTMLCSTGYQAQVNSNALGAASTNSTTFADVGNGTTTGFAPFVWTPPITKTYLVEVDFVGFCSALTAGADDVFFQLLVGATAYWPLDGRQAVYAINQRVVRPHFVVPVPFTAGVATTIKLQWKVNTATTTVFNVDTACFRTFTVRG